ncbi:deoxyguanosinetriphosphate triphosphohydrolase [Boudabousia marimammalium]|uniref:Deoxyguanosinetriphosphate triphosphohydrolase n=1 Tax=Boudabousia marimammalium TaxID=156892 RepID=A0A1Q5PPD6_9ACTO|nr:deoxyguanosinetriphosphate triphosphohydrolase [Boudabousia marimammalium]OKL49310.1 deoxyguanosinetriphosphate triphosphohydrolase [Boudabousia marimammalium]
MRRYEYSEADQMRAHFELPKSPLRSAFERDRARVLHSAALRRLGAKTQVLGPSSDDYIRTRLTHSLEVSQVGRGLGKMLGCDPDIVDAACLSHDLGHPPFGHNGERALAEVAKDCGGFEGNAQTLRLLVLLEPKAVAADGSPAGLNLTRAGLDATIKYPWAAGECPKGSHKFGYYDDIRDVFEWAREGAIPGVKSIEAQIMDLSDDIGYSVHDVEDAVQTGYLNPNPSAWENLRADIFASTQAWYGARFSADDLDAALRRLTGEPWWVHDFDGTYGALARLKDMSSQLIGRFVTAAVELTQEIHGTDPLGRYAGRIEVPAQTQAEITVLKGLATHFVMMPRETEPIYLQQRTLIYDLADAFWEAGPDRMEPLFAARWRMAENDAQRMRVVVDQIASMTDNSANQWHASLCGMLSSQ